MLRDALNRPHDPAERMDPDFPVAMRCEHCGKVGYGPRKHISEAVREHQQSCSAQNPHLTRIFYPRI